MAQKVELIPLSGLVQILISHIEVPPQVLRMTLQRPFGYASKLGEELLNWTGNADGTSDSANPWSAVCGEVLQELVLRGYLLSAPFEQFCMRHDHPTFPC